MRKRDWAIVMTFFFAGGLSFQAFHEANVWVMGAIGAGGGLACIIIVYIKNK